MLICLKIIPIDALQQVYAGFGAHNGPHGVAWSDAQH